MQFCTLSIYFSADDNLFYSRKKGSDKDTKCKVVCSAEEADLLFKEFHSSNTGSHFGQLKTRDVISHWYYWPGISADIEKWLSFCTGFILSSLSICIPITQIH